MVTSVLSVEKRENEIKCMSRRRLRAVTAFECGTRRGLDGGVAQERYVAEKGGFGNAASRTHAHTYIDRPSHPRRHGNRRVDNLDPRQRDDWKSRRLLRG